jgi:hypothetical protein
LIYLPRISSRIWRYAPRRHVVVLLYIILVQMINMTFWIKCNVSEPWKVASSDRPNKSLQVYSLEVLESNFTITNLLSVFLNARLTALFSL